MARSMQYHISMKYKLDTKTKMEEWIAAHRDEIIIFDAVIKSVDNCVFIMICYLEKEETL